YSSVNFLVDSLSSIFGFPGDFGGSRCLVDIAAALPRMQNVHASLRPRSMPDPTRLLKTLRQATRAFHDTPGRVGHLVQLAGAADVLVTGDLHGNVENFRRLLERAELRSHPDRHLIFQELVHGPFEYPTGGDKSHQAIDVLAALKCQFPRQVHMLLGNHELAQWTNQWIAKGD